MSERANGKIIRVQACHLYSISKGNYYSDYFVYKFKGKKRAQELELKAKIYGFRSKIEEKSNGYLLRIYGDSQEEIDHFINFYIRQNFELLT